MTGPCGRIQGGGGSSERQIMTNLLNEMDPSNVMLSSNIIINTNKSFNSIFTSTISSSSSSSFQAAPLATPQSGLLAVKVLIAK